MSNALKAARLPRWTIRQAEKSDDSRLFVVNKCKPAGNVNLTITGSGGERDSVQVPQTYIPVDLSNHAEKVNILRNPNFRRLVSQNHLEIVEPDAAEAFLRTEGVQHEVKRVYGVHALVLQPESEVVIESDTINTGDVVTAEDRALKLGYNPFVVNMMQRINSGEENPQDLISELDSRLNELKVDEIRFMADNVSEPKIKEWASETLQLLV